MIKAVQLIFIINIFDSDAFLSLVIFSLFKTQLYFQSMQ